MFGGREEKLGVMRIFGFEKLSCPKGHQLEVGSQRAPSIYIFTIHVEMCEYVNMKKGTFEIFSCWQSSSPNPHTLSPCWQKYRWKSNKHSYLEIQTPQKLRNAKKPNGLNSTLSKLLEIQAPRTCSQRRQPQRETSVLNYPFWFSKISKEG